MPWCSAFADLCFACFLFLLFLHAAAKGSKSKAVSKTGGGVVRQWDVLKLMVPEEEIPEFVDPMKWLAYFPPYGKEDLKRFGICTVCSYMAPCAAPEECSPRGFIAREARLERWCVSALTLAHYVCLLVWRVSAGLASLVHHHVDQPVLRLVHPLAVPPAQRAWACQVRQAPQRLLAPRRTGGPITVFLVISFPLYDVMDVTRLFCSKCA